VAIFVRELSGPGPSRAYDLANTVINTLACTLALLTVLGIVFAPAIVHGMALGFDADKVQLTVSLTRLMFPFILFVALAAVCMGMLNAQQHYALPQSASTFFNLTSICVGLACAYALAPDYLTLLWHKTAPTAATAPLPSLLAALLPAHLWPAPARAMVGMACGTLVGGLVQWRVQVPTLRRLGWRYRPQIRWRDPGLHDVLRLMGPAVLGAGAVQLSVFINSNFASTLGDRPISWLSYSFRLMQFPIGVFGVAVMTATLPALSRHAARKDAPAFADTLTQALTLVLCLTVPAAFGLVILGEPIVRLLFEHGRFGHGDTEACARALAAYALGLPSYSALKIIQPAFVAQGDAKTPMAVSLAGVLASVGLNYSFLYLLDLGHVGLALSTSVMATLSTATLLGVLGRRQRACHWRALGGQSGRIVLASAAMGMAIWAGLGLCGRAGWGSSTAGALCELGVLLPLSAAVYVGAGRAFGVTTLSAVLALAQRKLRPRE
jgi:putative peptidoglycan lipid II flippase